MERTCIRSTRLEIFPRYWKVARCVFSGLDSRNHDQLELQAQLPQGQFVPSDELHEPVPSNSASISHHVRIVRSTSSPDLRSRLGFAAERPRLPRGESELAQDATDSTANAE